MNYQQIQSLIQNELSACNKLMSKQMQVDVPLAEAVMRYAIGEGGKMFRPLLLLLNCKMLNYQDDNAITAACFIEFIHNATLLHDDVVDQSDKRRGKDSANVAFSNSAAVLVGDFVYTRAFQLMVQLKNLAILEVMSDATNLIAKGEVLQLSTAFNPDLDEKGYFQVIELKTAVLFKASCQIAGLLAKQPLSLCEKLANYGKYLGFAFQIMDDLLDYQGDNQKLGKNRGDDLAKGKITLPLIYALNLANEKDRAKLKQIIKDGDINQIDWVIDLLNKTGAINKINQKMQEIIEKAKKSLDYFADNDYKKALISLADLAIHRDK